MIRELRGDELASFIKERQAKQVRALRQARHIIPRLAIIVTTDNPVIATYVRLKQQYGADILAEVDVHTINQIDVASCIRDLNADPAVHGIIIQLPLADPAQTEELVQLVSPAKDIDALGTQAVYDPGTAQAINWLLAGYNIDLQDKTIIIVGHGRLVGAPLAQMWLASGFNVTILDENTPWDAQMLRGADIIVTAVGKPNLITSAMVRPGAVVVDAATTNENGRLVGDVKDEVRDRTDITITPLRGGVGPLTIAAIFDHLLEAASQAN